MFTDISTNDNYPKTLVVRNHEGGGIWQIYHVHKLREADILSRNATSNGFEAITLEDYHADYDETWPDWRETAGNKEITQE